MIPNLIGLSGKLLSGKDTVAATMANTLTTEYGLHVDIRAFADCLKNTVAGLTGCSPAALNSQAFKASASPIRNPAGGTYTYRQLLQQMGDMLRSLNPDILIDVLFANLPTDGYHIIPDVRKENEVVAIKARGGIIIRVERPALVSADTHNTETELDGYTSFDHVITNNGTLAHLEQTVQTLLANLMHG